MSPAIRLSSAVTALLLVAGCATPTRTIPPELQYQAPADLSASATLTGSQEKSVWADDFTAFVLAVDGKRVMAGRQGWAEALPVSAGPHRIAVEFKRGMFATNATLELDAQVGGQYQLQYSTDVQIGGPNTYCDFWIADAKTGQAVTAIQRGRISGGAQGPTFMPIFIPRR